eukprot:294313-Hanusia_phi.AAC.1
MGGDLHLIQFGQEASEQSRQDILASSSCCSGGLRCLMFLLVDTGNQVKVRILSSYKPTAEEHRYAESLQRSSMARMRYLFTIWHATSPVEHNHAHSATTETPLLPKEGLARGNDQYDNPQGASKPDHDFWQRLARSRQSQVAVSEESATSDQSGFRIVVEDDGCIRAVPKER